MAGLGRRTFAAGEVLTASNVMAYLQDQAVMNFAGTAARGSAIGSAVSEGMVSYLADSNLIESYDGSAWERQSGGLVPIRPTSITAATGTASMNATGKVTFTEVTRINLSGVFSNRYANYKFVYTLGTYSTVIDSVRIRLSSGGTDNTTADYSYGGVYINRSGSTGTISGNSLDVWTMCSWQGDYPTGGGQVDLQNPYVANIWASYQSVVTSSYRLGTEVISGAKANNGQFDGFSIIPSSSRLTGTVQVYGYKE